MQLVEKKWGRVSVENRNRCLLSSRSICRCFVGIIQTMWKSRRKELLKEFQKLRNLSFNMNNAADASGEFDAVPAYIRRKYVKTVREYPYFRENFYINYCWVGQPDSDFYH